MPRYSDVEMANLRVCDSDCMDVNGCSGHARCSSCGSVVCGCDLDDNGLCDDCAAEAAEAETDGCHDA